MHSPKLSKQSHWFSKPSYSGSIYILEKYQHHFFEHTQSKTNKMQSGTSLICKQKKYETLNPSIPSIRLHWVDNAPFWPTISGVPIAIQNWKDIHVFFNRFFGCPILATISLHPKNERTRGWRLCRVWKPSVIFRFGRFACLDVRCIQEVLIQPGGCQTLVRDGQLSSCMVKREKKTSPWNHGRKIAIGWMRELWKKNIG